jgi:dihydropteroate synthase
MGTQPIVAGLPAPGRTLVIGVVNVTPDSFSDGGEFLEPDAAVRHGLELLAEGADIIDIGGESTRPGAVRPTIEAELDRVLPVVDALASAGAVVSIDTMRPVVAAAAIEAGARLVNDVSGGRAEPDLLRLVADAGLPFICMHWRGHSADMQSRAVYDDVVSEVIAELGTQLAACVAAGIAPERIVADPGLGFAKTGEHNWTILGRLEEFDALGVPLLVGASRKAFLGTLLAAQDGTPRPPRDRDAASAALSALLAERGVWGVRVHGVRASRDAIAAADRMHRRS